MAPMASASPPRAESRHRHRPASLARLCRRDRSTPTRATVGVARITYGRAAAPVHPGRGAVALTTNGGGAAPQSGPHRLFRDVNSWFAGRDAHRRQYDVVVTRLS